jgi:hypothetical protein
VWRRGPRPRDQHTQLQAIALTHSSTQLSQMPWRLDGSVMTSFTWSPVLPQVEQAGKRAVPVASGAG